MTEKANILLVEDDLNLGFVIKDNLQEKGYKVSLHTDGEAGLQAFYKGVFDICILDVMMPKKDGFSLAEEIRKNNAQVPIVFLTAKSMEEDRIKGFRSGADDYVIKPFSMEEFILRLEAVLKRCGTPVVQEKTVFNLGQILFDSQNMNLTSPEGVKKLTAKECGILLFLCKSMNEVVKREQLLKAIWGSNDYFLGRSMDVYITKLRKYLQHDPSLKIHTIHGVGFKLSQE
jgi:DNA-binding response OmpR family regulator